jgi:hypothetical protein
VRYRFSLPVFAFVLVLVAGCQDPPQGGDSAGSGVSTGREGGENRPPLTDHLGSFYGRDPGGIYEFRLDVRENTVVFLMSNGFDTTQCRGEVPGGVRRRSSTVELDCGSDFRIAGVRSGLQMDFSDGTWTIFGTQSFSGLSARLQ